MALDPESVDNLQGHYYRSMFADMAKKLVKTSISFPAQLNSSISHINVSS